MLCLENYNPELYTYNSLSQNPMDALIIVLVAATWTGAESAHGRVVLSAMNAKQVNTCSRAVWIDSVLLWLKHCIHKRRSDRGADTKKSFRSVH